MKQPNSNLRSACICLAGILSLLFVNPSMGSTDENVDAVSDPHAAHRKMVQSSVRYVKSIASYSPPGVSVLDRNGDSLRFLDLMASESPLVLNFIFTSCTTICPVLSATFSQAQSALQNQPRPPLMVSLSIDPDYDTPERLKAYARNFHAGSDWMFLTGGKSAMLEIQKSFDAYRGDILNHVPLTFLRASPDATWVRLEGFTSSRQLVQEYESLLATVPD